jgi:hypothetical protein
MTSRLYQLDSQPTPKNALDDRFYSHFYVKRMAAEPLLDAIDSVTAVPTIFDIRLRGAMPPGTRAIELPDSNYPHHFLTTFAKPKRLSVCECERPHEESLAQSLHMLNGKLLADKIKHEDGRIARMLAKKHAHAEILNELFLSALSRFPTDRERDYARKHLDLNENPQEFYEDLLWVLLNSKQFKFIR